MEYTRFRWFMAGAVLATPVIADAQQGIPIRDMPAAVATSAETLSAPNGVRELADGRVLVNDPGSKRVLLLDRMLNVIRIVADSAGTTGLAYDPRASALIPFTGDSTILVDLAGRSFLVLDGTGRVARVMAPPRPNDVNAMVSTTAGAPQFDPTGRLIYRTNLMPSFKPPVPGKEYLPPVIPDSAPIIRADFDTRVADTLAWVRVSKIKVHTVFLPNGGVRLTPMITPISTVDDWTALADGSVAVLRGSDYHIDWIGADGSRRATKKMPFDWKPLTDEAKEAIIDTTRARVRAQAVADSARAAASTGSGTGAAAAAGGGHGSGTTSSTSGHGMTIMPVGVSDGDVQPQSATKGPQGIEVPEVVPASELPDYYPPILRTGMMKADPDGRVWLLPATSTQAGRGLLYDVVDREGSIVERVRLPEGRTVAGFGASGVVYLMSYGPGGPRLERTSPR